MSKIAWHYTIGERTVDIRDAIDTKLRDIEAISALVAAADSEAIDVDQLNDAGYVMLRMFEDVRNLRTALQAKTAGGKGGVQREQHGPGSPQGDGSCLHRSCYLDELGDAHCVFCDEDMM